MFDDSGKLAEALMRKRFSMEQLNIKLWRDKEEDTWSVEINGRLYKSLTITLIEELVAQALANTKQSAKGGTTLRTQ
jgi:hypothetical protein